MANGTLSTLIVIVHTTTHAIVTQVVAVLIHMVHQIIRIVRPTKTQSTGNGLESNLEISMALIQTDTVQIGGPMTAFPTREI